MRYIKGSRDPERKEEGGDERKRERGGGRVQERSGTFRVPLRLSRKVIYTFDGLVNR